MASNICTSMNTECQMCFDSYHCLIQFVFPDVDVQNGVNVHVESEALSCPNLNRENQVTDYSLRAKSRLHCIRRLSRAVPAT